MNYKKGFIAPLFLALVALLILGGGAYVYVQIKQIDSNAHNPPEITASTTQTSNPQTTGWKTYTNAKYGFEFEYPDNFVKSFEQESTDANTAKFTADFRISGCTITEGGTGINDSKCRFYNITVQDNKITEDGVGVSHTSTTMGNVTAEKIIWSEGGTSWAIVQTYHRGLWYIQQFTYPAGISDNAFDIIAQSFKFIQ